MRKNFLKSASAVICHFGVLAGGNGSWVCFCVFLFLRSE